MFKGLVFTNIQKKIANTMFGNLFHKYLIWTTPYRRPSESEEGQ